jgi:flagellar biogenesis protein FliO
MMNAIGFRISAGTLWLLAIAVGPLAGDDSGQRSTRASADITVDLNGIDDTAQSAHGDPLQQPIDAVDRSGRRPMDWASLSRWTKQPITAAVLSLAIVLMLYLIMRGWWRGNSRRRPVYLPRQVVEVIGYVPMGNRQQLQLVRLGSKLVLVAVTAGGAKSLAEVTDPVEVDQILAACRCGPSALATALGRWSTGRSGGREAARAVFEA